MASSSTTVTRSSSGAVGDIQQGDNVVVMGATSGSTLAADRITDSGSVAAAGPLGAGGPPPGGAANTGSFGFANGTVSAIDGSTLTITESSGTTVRVTTSSSTSVTIEAQSSLSSLKTGESVRVTGVAGSDGTVAATAIREGQDFGPVAGFGPPGRAQPAQ